ncbi:hypothetical protein VCUG_00319 [Vavraia culicis subsp. floridensis]|uniref:Uncharacterized protein n=1 Tax=Vavraia culicis (isolate floridensis) TaxID=948595 RepID=L2GYB3_VAVCU|nr:uncharacterized protein VCUG_00319 [Vavraia culicis subsp. floridensis]ELA48278.1 hypothetical protein VCUG_00319 [Vavraia culicis subsp. floridensis]
MMIFKKSNCKIMNSDGNMFVVRRSSGMLHVLVCLCCVVWARSEEMNRTLDAPGRELKGLDVRRKGVVGNKSIVENHTAGNGCVLPDDRSRTGRSLKVGRITPSIKQKNEQPLHSSASVLNRFVDKAHLPNDEASHTTTINLVKEYTLNMLGILSREKKFTSTGYSCEGYLRIMKDDVYRARSKDEQAQHILLSVLRSTADGRVMHLSDREDHFMMKGTKEGYEKVEKVLHSLLKDLKNCLRVGTISGSGCIERKYVRREHAERSSSRTNKLVLGNDEEKPHDIVLGRIAEMTTEQAENPPGDTVTEQTEGASHNTVTEQTEGASHNMVTEQFRGGLCYMMNLFTMIHALTRYAVYEKEHTTTCDAHPTESTPQIDMSSFSFLVEFIKNLLDQCQQSNTTFMVLVVLPQQVDGQVRPKKPLYISSVMEKAEGNDPCVNCCIFYECAYNTASLCDLMPFIIRIACSGKVCASNLPQQYLQRMSVEQIQGLNVLVENMRVKRCSNGQCTKREDTFQQELRKYLVDVRNASE